MNNNLLFLLFCIGTLNLGYAQVSPFHYQGILRNAEGELLVNQDFELRLSIIDDSGEGETVFEEEQSLRTDGYGQFSTTVGASKEIPMLSFEEEIYFLKVEVDHDGMGYADAGGSIIRPTPFSSLSTKALSLDGLDLIGIETGQTVKWNGTSLVPADDEVGEMGQSLTAGDGIEIIDGIIGNTGDADPDDDINTGDAAGGVLTGTFPNPGLADGSVSGVKIQDNSIGPDKLAPAMEEGSVLQFMGGEWITEPISASGSPWEVIDAFVGPLAPGIRYNIEGNETMAHISKGGTMTLVGQGGLQLWNPNNPADGMVIMSSFNENLRFKRAGFESSLNITFGSSGGSEFNTIQSSADVFRLGTPSNLVDEIRGRAIRFFDQPNANTAFMIASTNGVDIRKESSSTRGISFVFSPTNSIAEISSTSNNLNLRVGTFSSPLQQLHADDVFVGDEMYMDEISVGHDDLNNFYVTADDGARLNFNHGLGNLFDISPANGSSLTVGLNNPVNTVLSQIYVLASAQNNRISSLTPDNSGNVRLGLADPLGSTNYFSFGRGSLSQNVRWSFTSSGFAILTPNGGATMRLGSPALRIDRIFTSSSLDIASDRRLKKDIEKLRYGLDHVLSLEPVHYKLKADVSNKEHLGFIAQEVQDIIPEVVHVGEEDPQEDPQEGALKDPLGMTYTELIPVLVKAIQEQQDEINKLKQRISDLENQ